MATKMIRLSNQTSGPITLDAPLPEGAKPEDFGDFAIEGAPPTNRWSLRVTLGSADDRGQEKNERGEPELPDVEVPEPVFRALRAKAANAHFFTSGGQNGSPAVTASGAI